MLLAVNPLQWRKSYLVHAPTRWIANYIRASASACTGSRATAATGTRVASTSTSSRNDAADAARRSGRGRAGALDLVAHECGVGLAVRELELDAQPPK